jgi:uncharacterized protein (DUF433 family)
MRRSCRPHSRANRRGDVRGELATVAGTRITVELILEKLAAGETFDQILAAHPRLTDEGIRAAIGFAAEVLGADVVYPMEHAAA